MFFSVDSLSSINSIEQNPTLTLDHIDLVNFTIENYKAEVTHRKNRGQNNRLDSHMVALFQEDAKAELNAITQRLPHLQIGHSSIAVTIKSIESLQNGRRLRLPYRISQSKQRDG